MCQRPFKFHIRNRRNLFVAAFTRRRRKSASTRFFAKKSLKVKNWNLFFKFFLIILQERHSRTSYFVRALYFVRRWPSLGAKLGIPDEFTPNCFPITPPRNGNIGNGYRDPAKFLQKIKTTFLEHDYFPLLKLKMCFFFLKNVLLNYPFYLL